MLDLTLDGATRMEMARAFSDEWAAPSFVPPVLSAAGIAEWPGLIIGALLTGDDSTLAASLVATPGLLRTVTDGGAPIAQRRLAALLAASEFSTWHARAVATVGLRTGAPLLETFAAGRCSATAQCASLPPLISPSVVLRGHRAGYDEARRGETAVPARVGCFHSVRLPGSPVEPEMRRLYADPALVGVV